MKTEALTYLLAINAETPKVYMNPYEANAEDLCNALAGALYGSPELDNLTEGEMPAGESDVFYDLDLPDDDTVYHMQFFGTIDREGIEQLARDGWLSGPQCDTLGIMTGLGILPAVSIEQEMPYTYASVYVCPLYNGAVPSEPSFHRATRTLRNL